MPSTPAKKMPMNWDDYEYGRSPSQNSVGSWGRSMTSRANAHGSEGEHVGSVHRRYVIQVHCIVYTIKPELMFSMQTI